MDQEHPYELPTMDQSTNNSYSTGTSRPETKQKASMRCLLITIVICTVVLVLAIIAGNVAVTLTVGKQQSGASVLPSAAAASRLDDLESKMTSTNSELASTRTQLASMKTKLDSTTTELTSTKTELASTKTELATSTQAINVHIASLETQLNGSIRVNRGVFTAALYDESITALGGGHIVVFDTVLYNPGQDYDPQTGQFTCPLDGIYIFHTTVMTQSTEKHISAEIVKDGTHLANAIAEGLNQSGSVTVFTQCNKHQHVWVRVLAAHSSVSVQRYWSYFSGAFLRPAN